jgi:hypothetical protein
MPEKLKFKYSVMGPLVTLPSWLAEGYGAAFGEPWSFPFCCGSAGVGIL